MVWPVLPDFHSISDCHNYSINCDLQFRFRMGESMSLTAEISLVQPGSSWWDKNMAGPIDLRDVKGLPYETILYTSVPVSVEECIIIHFITCHWVMHDYLFNKLGYRLTWRFSLWFWLPFWVLRYLKCLLKWNWHCVQASIQNINN